MLAEETIYVLGEREELELDPSQLKLHRGGQPVIVEPKVLDVLHYLVRHRDRIVPSEELFAAFWPPHISATVLAHSVVVARRALGDTFERQEYIRTVRGRGYRFVGRTREHTPRKRSAPPPTVPARASDELCARLSAFVDRAVSGSASVVLLSGERGIGKTFRLQQLSALAASRGVRVLSGRSHESSPALWPWRQVALAASWQAPEHTDDDRARFVAFEALVRQLERAAQDAPLVVILDDLESADDASLELLRFATRELRRDARIVIACACRDNRGASAEPLASLLHALSREPAYERIALSGLSTEQTAELVAQLAGACVPELSQRVHAIAAGNPFFIRELASASIERGELLVDEDALTSSLPESVRAAVEHSLGEITPAARALLAAAAVIGHGTSSELLERVLSWPNEHVLARLDEATSARILYRSKGQAAHYTFTQPLVRIAIYDGLPIAERVRLHGEVARSLELAHGAAGDAQDDIAYHLYQAAPGGQADKALSCLLKVAAESLERSSYEESAASYRRALELLARQAQRDASLECQVQLGLGWVTAATGRRAAARDSVKRAASIAQHVGEPSALHTSIGGEHGALRAIVLSQLANLSRLIQPIEARRTLSAEAVVLAERSGDAAALASALMSRAWSLAGPDHGEERLAVTDRLFGLADDVSEDQLAWARVCRYAVFFERGELARADSEMERFAAFAETERHPAARWLIKCWHAQRALGSGRLTEAEALIEDARSDGERSHQRTAQLVHAAQRGNLCYQRGRLDLLALAFKPIGRVHASIDRIAKPSRIFWAAEQGAIEAARSELEAIGVQEIRACPRDELWMSAMWLYAGASAQCGAIEHAAALYEILEPRADLIAFDEGPLSHFGPVATVLSALALALGKRDAAERHAERARDIAARLGGMSALLARLQEARALAASGKRNDIVRARALAASIANEASELGMPHLARTASALACERALAS